MVPARQNVSPSSTHPSKIGVKVLERLSQGEMTALAVKEFLQSSREHAARLMNSLYRQGLVVRDESKKPYTYSLSQFGSDIITRQL